MNNAKVDEQRKGGSTMIAACKTVGVGVHVYQYWKHQRLNVMRRRGTAPKLVILPPQTKTDKLVALVGTADEIATALRGFA